MQRIITIVFVAIVIAAITGPKAQADALEAAASGAAAELDAFGSSLPGAGGLLATSAPDFSLPAAPAPSSLVGQEDALADISAPEDFATVKPPFIHLFLLRGDMAVEDVSITIHPFCVRPYDVDVVASDPNALVRNLTGVVLNGCGGDTSEF